MADLTKYSKGKRMPYEQDIEQIKKNKQEIEELVASKLTAGSGIVIEDNEVSVDEEVVAFKDELPAEVEAITPTGTETTLEGIKIGDTSYKVGGGDKVYRHTIELSQSGNDIHFVLETHTENPFNLNTLKAYLKEKYPSTNNNKICTGTIIQSGYVYGFILSWIGGTTNKMQYKGGNTTSWTDFTGTLFRDDVVEI